MYEVIALALGSLIGWLVGRSGMSLWWAALLGALAGMTVTAASGEIEISAAFLLLDAGQAGVAAVLVGLLVRHVSPRIRLGTSADVDAHSPSSRSTQNPER
jgi:hypothetical protein